jgi:hypothetical protein
VPHRRTFVIALVVVLAVGGVVGGWVGFDHWRTEQRLAQQRSDYTAGSAASGRADCAHALPLLAAARSGGSAAVASRAVRERHSCEELQNIQGRTANQAPTAALISWLRYLDNEPPKPYQETARTAARAVLTTAPMNKIMTAPLCRQRLELATYGILTTKHSDPLAPMFVSACAAAQLDSDPVAAVALYDLLRTTFPKQADQKEYVDALGQMVIHHLIGQRDNVGEPVNPNPGTFSLGGRTRLVVTNVRTKPIELILAGRTTRIIKVKGCTFCKKVPGSDQCDRAGAPTTTVTLPAGHYAYAEVDKASLTNLEVADWNLERNRRYTYCWFD